jgi:hypothetical protein
MGLRRIWRDLRQHDLNLGVVRRSYADERRRLENLTEEQKARLREHGERRGELAFPAFMIEHEPRQEEQE